MAGADIKKQRTVIDGDAGVAGYGNLILLKGPFAGCACGGGIGVRRILRGVPHSIAGYSKLTNLANAINQEVSWLPVWIVAENWQPRAGLVCPDF